MKAKWAIFTVLGVFSVLAVNSSSNALDTREIDRVRSKEALDKQDLQVIDDFLADGVEELLNARKFTDIAKLRTVILSRQSTTQKQYAQQFSASAYKHIMSGLQASLTLPADRRIKVTVNLMILIDGLADPALMDLSVAMLRSKDAVVRYWAVHSLTNDGIIKLLNSGDAAASQRARVVAEKLKELVDSSEPETLCLIAQFAGAVKIPQGEGLLLLIADARIKQYAAWKVAYELLDGTILRLLAEKMLAGGANKTALAYRFGQLYSFAIQRYVKGGDYLTEVENQRLVSVLVGTEANCVSKLLGAAQTGIRRAIERGDDTGLWSEHDRLLGTDAKAGELAAKIKFAYGPDSTGKMHDGPFALPAPPKTGPTTQAPSVSAGMRNRRDA